MQKLHPIAKIVFFLQFVGLLICLVFILLVMLYAPIKEFGLNLNWIIALIFVIGLPLSGIWAVLTYNAYSFEIQQDRIVIQKGVIYTKKTSIPFQRIQDVSIFRGILAKLLGFSSVRIETAGTAGQYARTEGYLPVLDRDVAEKISQEIISKTKVSHSGV